MLEGNLMDIDALSSFLNLRKDVVYKNYKKWNIPYVKMGRAVRFDTNSVKVWLLNRQVHDCNNVDVSVREKNNCRKRFTKEKVAIITTTTSQLQGKDTEGQLLQAINKKRKSL